MDGYFLMILRDDLFVDDLFFDDFFLDDLFYQFQILRKESQEPVETAIPSSVTPRQLTRLSWPARTPALSRRNESQTLQLKSSYPANNKRPDFEKATEVMPQMMLSWEYMPIS